MSSMNIIMFGATGAGKSSVINLIAGKPVAKISPDAETCTPPNSLYTVDSPSVPGLALHIWETIGLEPPKTIDPKSFRRMIEEVSNLVCQLADKGGVDLLLLCTLPSRVTDVMQRNYKLFYEILCGSQVPISLVITNLERQADMEQWWNINERGLERLGIKVTGHACVTGLQSHTKYRESRESMTNLLKGFHGSAVQRFHMSPDDWLIAMLPYLLQVEPFSSLKDDKKKNAIIEVLKKKHKMNSKKAESLAKGLLKWV